MKTYEKNNHCLLCVFSILIGHIAYNISGGASGLREDIGLEIKARSNHKLRTILIIRINILMQ